MKGVDNQNLPVLKGSKENKEIEENKREGINEITRGERGKEKGWMERIRTSTEESAVGGEEGAMLNSPRERFNSTWI